MAITLKAARVNAGHTQKKAAKILNISVDTLGNYERGKSFPSVPMIRKIERLYQVNFDDIIFLPYNNG